MLSSSTNQNPFLSSNSSSYICLSILILLTHAEPHHDVGQVFNHKEIFKEKLQHRHSPTA